MSAAPQKTTGGRIVGGSTEFKEKQTIASWTCPDEAAVDAMPPFHVPKPRSQTVEAVVKPPDTTSAPPLPSGIAADSTHAYLFNHSRETAAVVRTLIRKEEGGKEGGPLSGLSPQQVVAAILIGLAQEIGARICQHLNNDELQFVTEAISETGEVGHQLAMQALETVHQRVVEGDYVEIGGPEYARGLLTKVVGPHRANHFVDRTLYPAESGFDLLKNAAVEDIAPFISNEHPQTIALILSQLEPEKSAGVLAQLPERLQADVSYRMATTENVVAKVIEQVGEALGQSLRDIFGGDQDVGGPKVVADMLNMTGSSVERNVLNQMDAQAPEVSEAVRNLMFVFADIGKMSNREIQLLLREIEENDLAIALKAASEELRERFFSNMSEQARASVQEAMEGLEPMLRRDVEEVQLRIVQTVRQLEEQGKVRIVRGDTGDDYV